MSKELLVRFDQTTTPTDIIAVPEGSEDMDFLTLIHNEEAGSTSETVSYQWIFSTEGQSLSTGTYELEQRTTGGKVLRRVSKTFAPIPVTSSELDGAWGGSLNKWGK